MYVCVMCMCIKFDIEKEIMYAIGKTLEKITVFMNQTVDNSVYIHTCIYTACY